MSATETGGDANRAEILANFRLLKDQRQRVADEIVRSKLAEKSLRAAMQSELDKLIGQTINISGQTDEWVDEVGDFNPFEDNAVVTVPPGEYELLRTLPYGWSGDYREPDSFAVMIVVPEFGNRGKVLVDARTIEFIGES